MNTRLKQIRVALGFNQTEMANELGIGQPTYSQFETGARPLQLCYVKTLVAQYDVNEEWLMTGKGEMFVKSNQVDDFLETYNSLTEESKELIYQLILRIKKGEG